MTERVSSFKGCDTKPRKYVYTSRCVRPRCFWFNLSAYQCVLVFLTNPKTLKLPHMRQQAYQLTSPTVFSKVHLSPQDSIHRSKSAVLLSHFSFLTWKPTKAVVHILHKHLGFHVSPQLVHRYRSLLNPSFWMSCSFLCNGNSAGIQWKSS